MRRCAPNVPIVPIAWHEPGETACDTVNSDDRLGAVLAVQALVARGHRDLGFLAYRSPGGRRTSVTTRREEGYREAMAAAGLEARVFDVTGPREELETEIAAFLARPGRPRAVVVWIDLDAVPLLGLTHRAGIRVTEDLAIVGYDNSPVAPSPVMGLASFDQDGRGLGTRAAQALLSRIAGRLELEHRLVEPRLVLRSSR